MAKSKEIRINKLENQVRSYKDLIKRVINRFSNLSVFYALNETESQSYKKDNYFNKYAKKTLAISLIKEILKNNLFFFEEESDKFGNKRLKVSFDINEVFGTKDYKKEL